jgi:peptide/nickel transport system permease protein
MLHVITRRLVALVAAVTVSSLAVFLMPYLTPGDPVRKIIRSRVAGEVVSEDAVRGLSESLGLDDPLPLQYLRWLGDMASGDMGLSYASRTPVSDQVLPALAVTVSLVALSLGLAVSAALPLGIASGLRPGSATDKVVTTVTQALIALPEYWVGPALVLVFALRLSVLPTAGWNDLSSAVLPAVTLALRPTSFFTSAVRAGIIDSAGADHVVASRARGLTRTQSVLRHVVPNGLVPLTTVLAVWFAGLLGGSVIVEVIFAVPGMGRLLFDAVVGGDMPLAQGGVAVVVALAVGVTTLADLLHRVLTPPLRNSLA